MGKVYFDDEALPQLCLESCCSVWSYCEYLMSDNYAALGDASIRERVCTDLKETFEWGNLAHAIIMYYSTAPECPIKGISELVKLLEKLFDMGLDCNFRSSNHGFTFIHQAIFGRVEFFDSGVGGKDFENYPYSGRDIAHLIDLGAKIGFDFNLKCKDGNTLAHMIVDPRIIVRYIEEWKPFFEALQYVDYNFAALNDAGFNFFNYADNIIKELESTVGSYWTSHAYCAYSKKEFYDLEEFFKRLIDESQEKFGIGEDKTKKWVGGNDSTTELGDVLISTDSSEGTSEVPYLEVLKSTLPGDPFNGLESTLPGVSFENLESTVESSEFLSDTMFGFASCDEEKLMGLEIDFYNIRELGISDEFAISDGDISWSEILLIRLIQVRDCYVLKEYDDGDSILATVEAALSESDECKSGVGRQSFVEEEKTLIEDIIKHLKIFKFIYCERGKKKTLNRNKNPFGLYN